MENSVLIWTDNKEMIEKTANVVNKLGLELKEAGCETDVIAIPCFYIILDAAKLNKELIEYLTEMANVMSEHEQTILVVGSNMKRIKKPLSNFITKEAILPDDNNLEKYIKAAREKCPVFKRTEMNETYGYIKFDHTKKRIFRVWYMYKELIKNLGYVNTKTYACIFDVSEKTIQRDIQLLKSFGINIRYDGGFESKGYIIEN